MDSELWSIWEVFLVMSAPALAGLLGLCLIGLAWWQKLPTILRIIFGAAGGAVLLAALWIWVFRPSLPLMTH